MSRSPSPILYLGDTRLDGAAAYLAGVIHRAKLRFDYLPSGVRVPPSEDFARRKLVILSDYSASTLGSHAEKLVESVHSGCGLLMIGGWGSFRGLDGHWNANPVGKILPVKISAEDDRINWDQAAFVQRPDKKSHPILNGLPWENRPPCIGGFNRVKTAPGARTLLNVVRCRARVVAGRTILKEYAVDPLLVIGKAGAGLTAALMTDVAPHWVGPLVDWGDRRIKAQAPGANGVEVSDLYARFLENLVRWFIDIRVPD